MRKARVPIFGKPNAYVTVHVDGEIVLGRDVRWPDGRIVQPHEVLTPENDPSRIEDITDAHTEQLVAAQQERDRIEAESVARDLKGALDAANDAAVKAEAARDAAFARAAELMENAISTAAIDATVKANGARDIALARANVVAAQVADILEADMHNPAKEYPAGDLVQFDGGLYRALQNVPAGKPITDATYWERVGDYVSLGEAVSASVTKSTQTATELALERNRLNAVVQRMPAGSDDLATQAMVADEAALRNAADNSLAQRTALVEARLIRTDNLVTHPVFESGKGGWSVGEIVADTNHPRRSKVLSLTGSTYIATKESFECAEGEVFDIRIDLRAMDADAWLHPNIQWRDKNGRVVGYACNRTHSVGGDADWVIGHQVLGLVAPNGATHGRPGVTSTANTLFTDFIITRRTVGVDALEARIVDTDTASVSRDAAIAARTAVIEARMPTGSDGLATVASVTAAENASITRDNALSSRVTVVEARMPTGAGKLATAASVSAASGAAASATKAVADRVTVVEARMPAGAGKLATEAKVSAVDSASVARDNAIASRASVIEARMPTGAGKLATDARVAQVESASVERDQSIASRTTALEARMPSGTGALATAASVTNAANAAAAASHANAERLSLVEARTGGRPDNLVPQASFENGRGIWPSGNVFTNGGHPHKTHTLSAATSVYLPVDHAFNCSPGEVFDLRIDAKPVSESAVIIPTIQWLNAAGRVIGYAANASMGVTGVDNWVIGHTISGRVAPAGAVKGRPGVSMQNNGGQFVDYIITRRSDGVNALSARVVSAESAIADETSARSQAIIGVRSELGGNGNLLRNTSFSNDITGWSLAWNQHNTPNVEVGHNIGSIQRIPSGGGALTVKVPGVLPTGHHISVVSDKVQIRPGQRYCVVGALSNHHCHVGIGIEIFDASGNKTGGPTEWKTNQSGGGENINNWQRPSFFFTMPDNARTAHVVMLVRGIGLSNVHAWLTQPILCAATTEQTVPPVYLPGGNEHAAVVAEMRTDVDALAGTVSATYNLAVSAGGRVAGMRLGSNGATSRIDFMGDSARFIPPDGALAGIEIAPGNGLIRTFNNLGHFIISAGPFGAQNDLLMHVGPNVGPSNASVSNAKLAYTTDGRLIVRGTVEASLIKGSSFALGSTFIQVSPNTAAPFSIRESGYHSTGIGYGNKEVVVGDFYAPNNGSGYHRNRFARHKRDVYLEAFGSFDSPRDHQHETLVLQVSYDGGGWQEITRQDFAAAYKGAAAFIIRYTTLESWGTVRFRVGSLLGRTSSLSLKVEVLNFNDTDNAPGTNSGQTGQPGGGGGGGGWTPPRDPIRIGELIP